MKNNNHTLPHKFVPCPNCGQVGMDILYEIQDIPVNSVRVHHTREEAVEYPRGDLRLGLCRSCGFISNIAYRPGQERYEDEYESTQSYSPTFSEYSQKLASYLIHKHQLYGKKVLEVGCGMGEFLIQICEMGNNHGLGFDPAYQDRLETKADVHFVQDYYSEHYQKHKADFLVCKMTLEHIHQTGQFLRLFQLAAQHNPGLELFIQVPDISRILSEYAFWDIYYEHVSYFYPGALIHLLQSNGFEIINCWQGYQDQYLLITGRAVEKINTPPDESNQLQDHLQRSRDFSHHIQHVVRSCRDRLSCWIEEGQKIVLWGAGSKGVAFLTTLDVEGGIEFCVDINPHKQNTYMSGTGQKIVSPEHLIAYRPDTVIVMNPIYVHEIQKKIINFHLFPRVISVNELNQPQDILYRL